MLGAWVPVGGAAASGGKIRERSGCAGLSSGSKDSTRWSQPAIRVRPKSKVITTRNIVAGTVARPLDCRSPDPVLGSAAYGAWGWLGRDRA